MKAVVNKEDSYGRSITNKELRYIYRNRYSLENKVTFFYKGKKCEAPWKTDSQLWQEYKHLDKSFLYKWKKQTALRQDKKSYLIN